MFSAGLLAALCLWAPSHVHSADPTAAGEGGVRNALDDALSQLRDIILNGAPDKDVPVLDPLQVEKLDFEVNEGPLVWAEGSLSEVRLEGLGAFVVEQSSIAVTLLPPTTTATVRIRAPFVNATGCYRLNGQAHDITLDALGDFVMVIEEISVKAVAIISVYTVRVDVILGLGDIYIDVSGAGEVGDLINNEAADRIETWFAENRSELEQQVAAIIKEVIESSLGKRSQNGIPTLIATHITP